MEATTQGDCEAQTAVASTSAFKAAEKAYKAYKDGRQPDPERMRRLIDFDASDAAGAGIVQEAVAGGAPAWLRSARIYSISGVDGFSFIRCPFQPDAALELAGAALREWVEPPSVTNLVLHNPGPYDALWARHQREPAGSLLSRLTWATLGYHYQWTDRRYDPAKRSPFPPTLSKLAADLAAACGWQMRAEAAIVNLYGASSTMGGHLDDAEPCQSVPIVSISLGLEAIYLLGRETKADPNPDRRPDPHPKPSLFTLTLTLAPTLAPTLTQGRPRWTRRSR